MSIIHPFLMITLFSDKFKICEFGFKAVRAATSCRHSATLPAIAQQQARQRAVAARVQIRQAAPHKACHILIAFYVMISPYQTLRYQQNTRF